MSIHNEKNIISKIFIKEYLKKANLIAAIIISIILGIVMFDREKKNGGNKEDDVINTES